MSFGIGNNVRSKVRECTPELFHQALESQVVADVCAQIKDALEAVRRGEMSPEDFETLKGNLKKALIIFTFHATFKNGSRKNDDAIPSGLSIYDLDHIPNPEGRWKEIEPRKEELGIVLAHITPSSEGLRLVFIIPQGMNLEQAQAWMARELGDDKYDACVKDFARCSFAVPRKYVLFLDEEKLFSEESLRPVIQSEAKNLGNTAQPKVDATGIFPTSFKGIPYATIIEEWFGRNGGEPEPGERNSKLHRLASHLRYITDNNEEHLLQILPNYGLKEDEMRTLVHHACIAKYYGMPKTLKKLLSDVEKSREEEDPETINQKGDIDSPPPLPKRLPPLIKLLVSRTPKIYQPAVAHAVFPALGAHLYDTRFKYIDNCNHEATLACLLMAPTGSGKSCVNTPIDYIMADIRARDEVNLEKERKWKLETQSKGANKDKRERPSLPIQCIDADITSAAFNQRMADAKGRFLYLRMNEISQLYNLSQKGKADNLFDLLCVAFDFGNLWGQTRISASSVSERVTVRLNYNVSTTIRKGQYFFRNVLTDGPISRINICSIPERVIGSEMPVYGTYDDSFAEELKPYIDRLNAACGLVESPQVNRLAKKLVEECAEFARLSQSRVYENLSFRANVIAFLKAMVLYVAHGEIWDKSMEDFVRWSLQYDLYYKMKFFGDAIEAQEEGYQKLPSRGPQNLLDQLPEIFTREDAGQMRQRLGIRSGSLRQMLGNWTHRGYIELYGEEKQKCEIEHQRYIKMESYLKKHPQP